MLLDLLQTRRSIRKYKDQPVEQEKREQIIEAVLRSPSSKGNNPWSFIVVTDPKDLYRLSSAKDHGSKLISGASLAIVVCADPEISDVWIEDCAIASFIIQLTAHDLGLGSCWVQIRKREHNERISSDRFVKMILDIPRELEVDSIIAIGYPDEEKTPHEKKILQVEKVFLDRYKN